METPFMIELGLNGAEEWEKEERISFMQSTPDSPARNVEKLFWWLRDRVQSETGKLSSNTPHEFVVTERPDGYHPQA
jgi:hypothetical protein